MSRFPGWRGVSAADLKERAAKPNKYGAKKIVVDNHEFDSKAEAQRYHELKLEEKGGLIRDLAVHPSYDLVVNGQKIASYEADFAYKDCTPTCVAPGKVIVEDVKGVRTAAYQLKKRLMRACLGIEIREVR